MSQFRQIKIYKHSSLLGNCWGRGEGSLALRKGPREVTMGRQTEGRGKRKREIIHTEKKERVEEKEEGEGEQGGGGG